MPDRPKETTPPRNPQKITPARHVLIGALVAVCSSATTGLLVYTEVRPKTTHNDEVVADFLGEICGFVRVGGTAKQHEFCAITCSITRWDKELERICLEAVPYGIELRDTRDAEDAQETQTNL